MGSKLYVGNLSFNATEDGLRQHFQQCGSVESCKLVTDRETGRSKGFAFVEMSSPAEAQQAITNLDDQEFEGRNLRVNEAKPQEKKSFNKSRW